LAIAAGPDVNLWFMEFFSCEVAKTVLADRR